MHSTTSRLLLLPSLWTALACSPAGGGAATMGSSGGTGTGSSGSAGSAGSAGTSSTGSGGGSAGSGSTTGGPTCEPKPKGECTEHDECMSAYCETHLNIPPDPDAECADPLPEGNLRIVGTTRDFLTGAAIPDIDVKIAGALPTASDPVGVMGIAMATSDGNGEFDVETNMADGEAIGLVALVEGPGHGLTAVGLVEADIANGAYPPGATNHDIWLIDDATRTAYSDLLADDPALELFLPIGDAGGVIGRVRDNECDLGIAGAVLVSRLENSQAIVRYLDEDGNGFNATATGSSGIFVVLNPALAEKFDAAVGGMQINSREGTMGSAPGATFAVTISEAYE